MSSIVTSGSLMSRFLPFSGHHQQQAAAAAAQRHHRQSSTSSSSSSSDEAEAAVPYRVVAADEIAIIVADQWTTSGGFSGSSRGKKAAVSSRASTCSVSSSTASSVSSSEDEQSDRYMAAAIAFAEEVGASIYRPSYDFDSDAECSTSTAGAATTQQGGGLKRVASSLTNSAASSRKVSAVDSCQKPASNSLIPSCSVAYSTMMFNNNSHNNNNGWSSCTHVNRKNGCAVEARQIEMEFVTLSARPFQLQITAPNGERSARFAFKAYAQRAIFSPRRAGCGHGLWTIETAQLDANNKKTVNKESIFLDGVGSLFFSIDEHLQIRLVSQEFLRLPSASQ